MTVDDILRLRLEPRTNLISSDWKLWEHKTLNIHRGLLCWRNSARTPSFSLMAEMVREQVASRYRVAWWRGFAYATLTEAETLPADLADIEDWIDVRAKGRGVWQWVIYVCRPAQIAIGVHIWQESYLTPT